MDSNSEARKAKEKRNDNEKSTKEFYYGAAEWMGTQRRRLRVLHHDRIWDAWTSGMPEN